MDFAALPPEVTSSWVHTGSGSASLLAASAAWDRLAVELGSTASDYRAVIAGLAGDPWRGPAATSMAGAAAPYAQWMTTTAEQARHAADQARAAAVAYQAVFAAVTPPPMIAANRAQLQSLAATNVIGQNTAAIAANQAQYAEMWARNATAMYNYATGSAAATQLAPFTAPAPNTTADGSPGQAAAVAQATATGTGTQVPALLQSMTSGTPVVDLLQQVNTFLETNPLYVSASAPLSTLSGMITTAGSPLFMEISPIFYLTSTIFSWFPAVAGGTTLPVTVSEVSGSPTGSTLVGTAAGDSGAARQPGGGVSAGSGRAAAVGGLSVPSAWTTGPTVKLAAAAALPGTPMPGPGGTHAAIPPIASVVNAPRTGAATRDRATARGTLIPQFDQAADAAADDGGSVPDPINPLSDREREELTGLRTQLVKLVMKQDALTRLMNEALRP